MSGPAIMMSTKAPKMSLGPLCPRSDELGFVSMLTNPLRDEPLSRLFDIAGANSGYRCK
jgi:hypothetical protein